MVPLSRKIRIPHVCAFVALLLVTIFTVFHGHRTSIVIRNEFPFKEDFDTLKSVEQSSSTETLLREKLKCTDKDQTFRIERRGNFWVLVNYIKARLSFKCYESITYTTHVDFTFVDNIEPLVERWLAPVSVAVYGPKDDYQKALESVIYVRNCLKNSSLIRDYVTFHFFFEREFTPTDIMRNIEIIENGFQCVVDPPYQTYGRSDMFKTQKNLFYPINVARNIARVAATTHFVLASDIELYPNPGLVVNFLDMYFRRDIYTVNEVFVLPIFEVDKTAKVPLTKLELCTMLTNKTAIPFHALICATCHSVPSHDEWVTAKTPSEMTVFATTKRQNKFAHWEPIYIGTNMEPLYEEQLHWEGKSDKMTQGYTLCLLDYDFNVLNEGFLVHRPGIKTVSEAARPKLEKEARDKLMKQIVPQINALYGERKGCVA